MAQSHYIVGGLAILGTAAAVGAASYKGVLPVEKKTELVESIADITTNRATTNAYGDRGMATPGAADATVELVGTGAVAPVGTVGGVAAVDTNQPVVATYGLTGVFTRNERNEIVQTVVEYRAENSKVQYAVNDLLEEAVLVAGHRTPSQELGLMRIIDGDGNRTITADEIFAADGVTQRYTPKRGNGSRVILEDPTYAPPQATNQPGARPPRTIFRNRNSGPRGNR